MAENNKKRALFIDRDGTIVVEPPVDYQLDSFEKFEFVPGVIGSLAFIARTLKMVWAHPPFPWPTS